jgi:hypothetical protein
LRLSLDRFIGTEAKWLAGHGGDHGIQKKSLALAKQWRQAVPLLRKKSALSESTELSSAIIPGAALPSFGNPRLRASPSDYCVFSKITRVLS